MTALLMDFLSAVLLLSGAGSPEELGAGEMERFQHFAEHPLRVNRLPAARLVSSGLFTEYQAEAVQEYRRLSGDILSLAEFSLVDGIGGESAEALAFFVSFESSRPPGEREDEFVRHSLDLRGGVREKAEAEHFYGAKYHLEAGSRAELFFSSRKTYSGDAALPSGLSLAVYPDWGGKLIMGDFAARFGQGLALWSAFSLSGFGSVDAFRRKGGGLAPTGSFNPVFSGIAGDFAAGGWTLSAALAVPALRDFLGGKPRSFAGRTLSFIPVMAARHTGKAAGYGFQAYFKDGAVLSADGVLGLGHWTLYGEAALSSLRVMEDGYEILRTRAAALLAASWSPAYRVKGVLLARYYPSGYCADFAAAPSASSGLFDEAGLALGFRRNWAEFTADAALFPRRGGVQLKTLLSLKPEFKIGAAVLKPSLRWTERCKTTLASPWRHEVRIDLSGSQGDFTCSFRADLVRSRGWGFLSYVEAGRSFNFAKSGSALSTFLRAGIFSAPFWEDRVYAYERDIPGAFSVPAYYGKGWEIYSLTGLKTSRKGRFRHGLHLKLSLLAYFEGEKPAQKELKLCYKLDF